MNEGPADMEIAGRAFLAACGHGAFAAACELSSVLVGLQFFEKVCEETHKVRSWVNMPDMEGALTRIGAQWGVDGRSLPTNGVAILQWEGPWTRVGVPARVACMYRHWVALRTDVVLRRREVWDANLAHVGWVPEEAWKGWVPQIFPEKATGWKVARGYHVCRRSADGVAGFEEEMAARGAAAATGGRG